MAMGPRASLQFSVGGSGSRWPVLGTQRPVNDEAALSQRRRNGQVAAATSELLRGPIPFHCVPAACWRLNLDPGGASQP